MPDTQNFLLPLRDYSAARGAVRLRIGSETLRKILGLV